MNKISAIEKSKTNYFEERKNKVKKYEKRILAHEKKFENHSWQIFGQLNTNSNDNLTINLKTKTDSIENINKDNFFFIDCDFEKAKNFESCSLKSFLELKVAKKRDFKKFLKKYHFFAPITRSSVIMKSLAKILSKYKKDINFLNDSELSKGPNSIIENYKNSIVLLVKKGKISTKIGSLKESPETIADRIDILKSSLDLKDLKIKELYLKPLYGKPTKL